MLFAYFLFLLCTFPSCLSQGNLLQIFTDFRVINNNGTHLTFSWNQASNATSSASYFIHYAQVDFDHGDDSKHIQAPVLLRTGNSYTYSFPKELLLPDGLYGTLYFYVRVSFSSQNWYTNGLSVATGLAQSKAFFALDISLTGLDCAFARGFLSSTSIIRELEFIVRRQVPTFHSEFGKIEGYTFCRDQTWVFRGAIFTAGSSASACINALDQWLSTGQAVLASNGRHFYVSRPSCGLELSSIDVPDCTVTSSTSSVVAASEAGGVDISLIISCIALALVVLTILVFFVYLLYACFKRRVDEKGEVTYMKTVMSSTNPSYTHKPSVSSVVVPGDPDDIYANADDM